MEQPLNKLKEQKSLRVEEISEAPGQRGAVSSLTGRGPNSSQVPAQRPAPRRAQDQELTELMQVERRQQTHKGRPCQGQGAASTTLLHQESQI